MGNLLYEEITYKIRRACFNVYNQLGGLLKENIIERALVIELKKQGLTVETRLPIDVYYEGEKVGTYIPDAVINRCIIVELKAKQYLTQQDNQQALHYLYGTNYKLVLLINFGPKLEIRRFVFDEKRTNIYLRNPRSNPRNQK